MVLVDLCGIGSLKSTKRWKIEKKGETICRFQAPPIKEYIERRQGEPFKFLFLPKMGILGSQACTRNGQKKFF